MKHSINTLNQRRPVEIRTFNGDTHDDEHGAEDELSLRQDLPVGVLARLLLNHSPHVKQRSQEGTVGVVVVEPRTHHRGCKLHWR